MIMNFLLKRKLQILVTLRVILHQKIYIKFSNFGSDHHLEMREFIT